MDLSALPDEVREDLLSGGRLADIGQPYFSLDAIGNSPSPSRVVTLPVRRLVLAGRSGENWFVWVESYLPALYDEVFGYRLQGGKWHRATTLRGDPCLALNAIAGGVQDSFDTLPRPLTYKDPRSNILFFVGRDGRRVTAIAPDGKIVWDVEPLADAGLDPYRTNHAMIRYIGTAVRAGAVQSDVIAITYNSTQSGTLRISDGRFAWQGQD
ncbi:hypothetical protein [Sphingomonas sp. UYAg733]